MAGRGESGLASQQEGTTCGTLAGEHIAGGAKENRLLPGWLIRDQPQPQEKAVIKSVNETGVD